MLLLFGLVLKNGWAINRCQAQVRPRKLRIRLQRGAEELYGLGGLPPQQSHSKISALSELDARLPLYSSITLARSVGVSIALTYCFCTKKSLGYLRSRSCMAAISFWW